MPSSMIDIFIPAVRSSFQFLEREYGFNQVVERPPYSVEFVSTDVMVRIGYDPRGEADLFIHRLTDPSTAFSLGEFIALDVPRSEPTMGFMVSTAENLQKLLDQWQMILIRYGKKFIRAEDTIWVRLIEQRRVGTIAYALESQLTHARSISDAAWRKLDYAAVAEALTSIREHLSPAEIKKLEYSMKQVDASK